MIHIRCICQEICDIKNPLHSCKGKFINKVYLRSSGPKDDTSRVHLLDKYGEGDLDGNYFSYSTPIPPLGQYCNPYTNWKGEARSASLLPSPTATSPNPSH